MKRRFALMLALALMLAACSSTLAESVFPTWTNGLSPQQPYKGVAPVDLTTKMGYMVFYPLNGKAVTAPVSTLSIYLPRADVAVGMGSLKVYSVATKQPLEMVAFSDAKRVSVAPLTEADKQWLYWESGVCFSIQLTRALPVDGSYYVTLDGDCIAATDYAIKNPEMTNKDGWAFTTSADYGVASASWPDEAVVGDAATIDVKLGGEAVSATIVGESDVDIDNLPEELIQSDTITVTFLSEGEAVWNVAFFDAQGNTLAFYRYITAVGPAPAQP